MGSDVFVTTTVLVLRAGEGDMLLTVGRDVLLTVGGDVLLTVGGDVVVAPEVAEGPPFEVETLGSVIVTPWKP